MKEIKMALNLFLNSYKKKEDELTYAFFSMVETINSKELYEYLSQKTLIKNPLKNLKLLPVGNNTNPDGELLLTDENSKDFKLLFENKTKIRNLDREQLLGHLTLCKTDDKLLVITPRKSDKSIIDKIKDKRIIFYTWSEISDKLNKEYSENILAKQFIEYGKITGQFEEMGEKNYDDIINEIGRQKIKFDDKFDTILSYLKDKLETESGKYFLSKENITIVDEWGRKGIEIRGKKKRKTYGQWIFLGYYYNEEDHNITFKKDNVPEIAIFFDIYEGKENIDIKKILEDEIFCEKIKKLKNYGFENNLDGKITDNANRLFFIRKSLDDFDKINAFVLNDFFEEAIEKINNFGLNECKYFKELQ
jgi:hypothetical protein